MTYIGNDKIFKSGNMQDGRDFITAIKKHYLPFSYYCLLFEVAGSIFYAVRNTNASLAAPRNSHEPLGKSKRLR